MIAALVVAAAVSVPPPQSPDLSITAPSATITAARGSFCTNWAGHGICGDTAFPSPESPIGELDVAPGDTLTLVPDASTVLDGTELLSERAHELARLGTGTAVTLPATLPGVSYLFVGTRWRREDANGDVVYIVRLTHNVAPLARASSVRHGASRVHWTVSCPKSVTRACAGTSTVRADGRLVARKSFRNLAAGRHRTLAASIRPAAKRYLRRHRAAALSVTVSRGAAGRRS